MLTKIKTFLREVRSELKKVSWPNRAELQESTVVVIVAVFIISMFIYAVDILISKGVQAVL